MDENKLVLVSTFSTKGVLRKQVISNVVTKKTKRRNEHELICFIE